jgi:hypothetical protein
MRPRNEEMGNWHTWGNAAISPFPHYTVSYLTGAFWMASNAMIERL